MSTTTVSPALQEPQTWVSPTAQDRLQPQKQVDDPVQWVRSLDDQIGEEITRIKFQFGIRLLEEPNCYDGQNKVHEAIWQMRWNTDGLNEFKPQQLCAYERVLTAHQVYVQAQENYWASRANYLGKEKDRVFRDLRKSAEGSTEKDKDNHILRTNPQARTLYAEHRRAEAYAHFLTNMGERFAQLQNGLKRSIDLAMAEYQTTIHQSRFQH